MESSLLWISADAGCGKSVLTKFLIDTQLRQKTERPKNVCYFFFKNDNDEQKSSTYALCAILHQIYTYQPELLKHASLQFARKGPTVTKQFDTLWAIFKATVEDGDANDIICFIDGLDDVKSHLVIS
jgi:NACHT domain